jgi:hypothetical protein
MTGFYKKYEDNSKDTIAKTAEFLNKKPNRQGSNQLPLTPPPSTEKKDNKN